MTQEIHECQMVYLLVHPNERGETAVNQQPVTPRKGIPYFQPIDISVQLLEAFQIQLESSSISVQPQIYDGHTRIDQCVFNLSQPLSNAAIGRKERIETALQQTLLTAEELKSELWEGYSILIFDLNLPRPADFVAEYAPTLAQLLRSQADPFSEEEVRQTLISRVQYAANDLAVIDWDGAVMLSPYGDDQADIELFKIGSYQLLRYRLLDKRIEERLRSFQEAIERRLRFRPLTTRREIQALVAERLTYLLDFEHIEQELLLIGDWYTAQLYHTIIDEFYLDDWKKIVKNKLENLESVMQIVVDNLSGSWSHYFDMVELVGWFVLLVGYFVLFYLDVITAILP
ncbi:MAG: hypothetical protein KC449_27300 [Anaerolineales bacterium]|nr:hypothetical protein [Anaerolineales bacterium]